ncbi:MAG TPA: alpha/beta hydrolase [Pseudolabrys sp.]|nr:alpha/beta hydrolase [Pseudolabrys sp.]
MSTLKWLLIVAVLGYGGVLALMYVFQRALQYFPDTTRTLPAQAGLPQAEEVTFPSDDGERLLAWYVPARDGKKLVLYFQGNAGGLDLRADRFNWLTADGTGLLALCYRGYGGSSGRPSEDGLIRDARAAYRFTSARLPANRIVLFGESLGTGVAVALAAEQPPAGLILDAPFTSAADVGANAYPFAPVRWLLKDPFRSDRRIGRVTAPLLVLHGERDRIIPIGFAERLFALANEPKRMVRFAQGSHVNLDDFGAPKAIREFLAELP